MSTTNVRARLRDDCLRRGGQRAWARVHDVADTYVSGVIAGRQEPGPKILRALGLQKGEPTYIEIWEPSYEG